MNTVTLDLQAYMATLRLLGDVQQKIRSWRVLAKHGGDSVLSAEWAGIEKSITDFIEVLSGPRLLFHKPEPVKKPEVDPQANHAEKVVRKQSAIGAKRDRLIDDALTHHPEWRMSMRAQPPDIGLAEFVPDVQTVDAVKPKARKVIQ